MLHMLYLKKKKNYYHIVMIINSKLEIDYDILKNISSQIIPCTPHQTAHVIAKLEYSVVMVLVKPHRKVWCLQWLKTAV